jgi:hypothetical protein
MVNFNLLRRITSLDLRRHEKAVAKLRCRLFDERSPATCHIVGAERILPPSVDVRMDLVNDRPVRNVMLGGLEYVLRFPQCETDRSIAVKHWAGAQFWLYASFGHSDKTGSYTRYSKLVLFSKLPQVFLACIDQMEYESRPIPPSKLSSHVKPEARIGADGTAAGDALPANSANSTYTPISKKNPPRSTLALHRNPTQTSSRPADPSLWRSREG